MTRAAVPPPHFKASVPQCCRRNCPEFPPCSTVPGSEKKFLLPPPTRRAAIRLFADGKSPVTDRSPPPPLVVFPSKTFFQTLFISDRQPASRDCACGANLSYVCDAGSYFNGSSHVFFIPFRTPKRGRNSQSLPARKCKPSPALSTPLEIWCFAGTPSCDRVFFELRRRLLNLPI